jgi:two-component system NtrC family sensor kinase
MRRRLISAGLAIAALAMLGILVLGSRPMPVEQHLAHRQAIAETERATGDFETLRASLESDRLSNQPVGDATLAAIADFQASPDALRGLLADVGGRPAELERLRSRFEAYAKSVDDAASLMRNLASEQNVLVENLGTVRRTGPDLVERMREIRLEDAARATFELVAGTLDYVTPGASIEVSELRGLIDGLRSDQRIDANMPGEVQALVSATEAVLANKPRVALQLVQLTDLPLPSASASLGDAAESLYRTTLDTINQARTLLAVFAILLLAAAAVIAFRLSQSYQILNRVNADLAVANGSLEQRVAERTAELEQVVHELKESQVQLVQAEKMSSLGQLVAGISHEINTPLLYLANNAELLRERLDLFDAFTQNCNTAFSLRPDDFSDRTGYQVALAQSLKKLRAAVVEDDLLGSIEEANELLADSSAGLEELTEMARGLKDFSRLDRAPIEAFDVNAGLERTLLIARGALKHKANVSRFFGEIPEIQCSPSQINQVFLNLLTNAAHAIEDHGEIVVRTAPHGDAHVAVTIADNGCGISPENLTKIRDPFFTTKEVGSGTGLGLSIVDQIISAHGGELRIESELGKGSAFTVILPIESNDAGTTTDENPLLGLDDEVQTPYTTSYAAAG